MKALLFAVLVLSASSLFADQNKQALKAIEKGDYVDAEEHLQKSLESDPVNPGARYIYSLLYVDVNFPRYSIDSAYFFILDAIIDFDKAEEKILKELSKNEIQRQHLIQQKVSIEDLAFQRADAANTIEDYEFFMENFETAEQVPTSIAKRDMLVFENVRKENTWQAYQGFIKNYPKAEQVAEAQEAYETLLYQDLTKDGKLKSLESFLRDNPDSPYRRESERRILEIRTTLNRPEEFLSFLRDYPESSWNDEVRGRLFHVDKDHFGLSFFDQYAKRRSLRDSLKRVVELSDVYLLPFYEREKYGFMSGGGEIVLPARFEYIKEDYLCAQIFSDLLEVREDGKLKLIDYQGTPAYEGGFDVATDLTAGFVKMRKNGRFGVWHKGGHEVLPAHFEDIQLLGSNILKVKTRGKWAIYSAYGKELMDPLFNDIYLINDYWIFEKDGFLAVTNLEALTPLKDGGKTQLDFKYDEVELVKGEYLLCYAEDNESLIDPNLDIVINSSDHTIIPLKKDWLVKRENGYSYYHEENGSFLEDSFNDISYSKGWFAFERDSTWTLLSEKFGFEPKFGQDSVRVLNDFMAFFKKGDTARLAFHPNRLVDLDPEEHIELMGIPSENDSSQYLAISGKETTRIYSENGIFQFGSKYDQVDYISEGYFSFEYRKRKGILNTNGRIVLKAEYDGIGQVEDSLAPILQKGKFGLFDLRNDLVIKPAFRKKLTRYGDYLVGLKDDGYGLLDLEGEELTEFNFASIEKWNDEVALVKKEGSWALYEINTEEYILEEIQRIDYLKDDPEEKIAYLLTNEGFGVFSNTRGEILSPSFNDIINLGTVENPLYFAEKHVPEADFYVVVYTDSDGNTIRSDAFRENEYDLIVCDQ